MNDRLAWAMRLITGGPGPDDIVLGEAISSHFHAQYRLTPEAQRYHTLWLGTTGTGKSKGLQAIALQHLTRGHAIGIVDPHGDLARATMASLVAGGYLGFA